MWTRRRAYRRFTRDQARINGYGLWTRRYFLGCWILVGFGAAMVIGSGIATLVIR